MNSTNAINYVSEQNKLRAKVVEEKEIILPEIFISITAKENVKQVADEVLNALDKEVYKDIRVKTRLGVYGGNFYTELDEDIDILVLLPIVQSPEKEKQPLPSPSQKSKPVTKKVNKNNKRGR